MTNSQLLNIKVFVNGKTTSVSSLSEDDVSRGLDKYELEGSDDVFEVAVNLFGHQATCRELLASYAQAHKVAFDEVFGF